MKIQTGLRTTQEQDTDREAVLAAIREMGVVLKEELPKAPDEPAQAAPTKNLYEMAYVIGFTILLLGLSVLFESGGASTESLTPGIFLLVTGMAVGLLGSTGSKFA